MLNRISSVSRNKYEVNSLTLDCGTICFPNFSLKYFWRSIAILFLLRKEDGNAYFKFVQHPNTLCSSQLQIKRNTEPVCLQKMLSNARSEAVWDRFH